MRIDEHCARSLELFGDTGLDYHLWIDQYARRDGWMHRRELHHKEGISQGVFIFGEEARPHLEKHVLDDYTEWRDTVPTRKEVLEIYDFWTKK
ncbi:hypothetical protein KY362_01400 [Candidatus Woesearchaeota archaeon]|nr:hypothetical protein [Candidatus Woesearchaeota archaeon]